MQSSPEGGGFAVACTLAEWISLGPRLKRLHLVVRVTLTDLSPDGTFPARCPPQLQNAVLNSFAEGDTVGDSISAACLDWARGVAAIPR